jgi:[ribosomal protein S5]-alanine N-acetyltransferase
VRPIDSRVYIERPATRHARDFLDACHRSRALHRGLVATAATPADYRHYLGLAQRPSQESFLVVAADSDELAGVVDILDIDRDAMPTGRLAYFAFVPHAGSGLMREGVSEVIDVAFHELGLARLHADIQHKNRRSRAFAERLGFRRHGAAQVLLNISARWREHERWTLRRDDWRARGPHELAARA